MSFFFCQAKERSPTIFLSPTITKTFQIYSNRYHFLSYYILVISLSLSLSLSLSVSVCLSVSLSKRVKTQNGGCKGNEHTAVCGSLDAMFIAVFTGLPSVPDTVVGQ